MAGILSDNLCLSGQLEELKQQVVRAEKELDAMRRDSESEQSRREAVKAAQKSEELLRDRLHHVRNF